MAFPTLRTLLNLMLALLLVVAGLLTVRTVESWIEGEPLRTQITVVTNQPVERAVLDEAGAPTGSLKLSHGKIDARIGTFAYVFDLIQGILVLTAGLAVIWQMRKLLLRIAAGNAFDLETIRHLRLLGLVQLGAFAWIIVSEVFEQVIVLRNIRLNEGAILLPSISSTQKGVENVQIDFSLGFGWLLGGIAALVVAKAFQEGAKYRDDSEAVI